MGRGVGHHELESLYRARFDTFVRVAASVTGDASLAHDAVQDGFAHALRSLGTFRGDAPLEAWVWRIVINAAHDARPAGELELVAELPEPASRVAGGDGAASNFGDWVSTLPERQRLVVFLRYAADLDYRGIAHALGIEVGTVSATLHAAHERLRRSYEEVPR